MLRFETTTVLLLLLTTGPLAAQAPPVTERAAFDALFAEVRTADSTIQVDVRYAGADNFTGAPLPGYGPPVIHLRRDAAAALGRVQRRLASGGLGLRVWDGYRPVRATEAMVAWAEQSGQRALVDSGYIASRSRHNTGFAVDLTLVDLVSGSPLDLGTPFDTFDARAHTANATGRTRALRQVLVRAMAAEGFRNYEKEWWHFWLEGAEGEAFDVEVR